jgi:hypothetical protein
MTTKTLLLSLLALNVAGASGRAAEPLSADLIKQLSNAIMEHCPEAEIAISESGVFTAKHGTMMYTLHSTSKTGEVYPQTYQKEGPNFKGFILTVSLQDGRYEGAAVVPQTLQGPYFPTLIDAPGTGNGQKHYRITFSYGSRLDAQMKSAILDHIPKTKFRGSPGAADGRQPTLEAEKKPGMSKK